ncbi:tyrosine aminotransferase [Stylonychia lemnae]|uniref:Tyrosine aminotransferase n=1 Tax=Stylonychia lemnae TaxID=5949 RepID=A0A077ZTY8_STYLE|nr:tyrosine aminotransferase [Stylonychia lemnae]|eukprot:CDW72785.1 tyrosine aminotransferase [Stylonychia lemnae]
MEAKIEKIAIIGRDIESLFVAVSLASSNREVEILDLQMDHKNDEECVLLAKKTIDQLKIQNLYDAIISQGQLINQFKTHKNGDEQIQDLNDNCYVLINRNDLSRILRQQTSEFQNVKIAYKFKKLCNDDTQQPSDEGSAADDWSLQDIAESYDMVLLAGAQNQKILKELVDIGGSITQNNKYSDLAQIQMTLSVPQEKNSQILQNNEIQCNSSLELFKEGDGLIKILDIGELTYLDIYIPYLSNRKTICSITTDQQVREFLTQQYPELGKKINLNNYSLQGRPTRLVELTSFQPACIQNVYLLGDVSTRYLDLEGNSSITNLTEDSYQFNKLIKRHEGEQEKISEKFSSDRAKYYEQQYQRSLVVVDEVFRGNFAEYLQQKTQAKSHSTNSTQSIGDTKLSILSDENLCKSLQDLDKSDVDWNQICFEPSKQTSMKQPMPYFVFEVAKFDPTQPIKNGKTELNKAVIDVIEKGAYNGYTHHQGAMEARQAIVTKYSHPEFPFTPRDVFLTFGCHGAMFASMSVLCNRGDNILIPNPTFPLAVTICQNLGIDSVFNKEHQLKILEIARKYKLPILADEVYFGIVYPGKEYHPFANLSKDVPILSINSLSKTCLLPGWRFGWVIVYNRHGYFDKVLHHLDNIQKMIFPPASIVQYALPKLFECYNEEYYNSINARLGAMAEYVFEGLNNIRGIQPIRTSAGMFMMVKILSHKLRDIEDDQDFCLKFFEEQSVLTLPSWCFYSNGFFRIVRKSFVLILTQYIFMSRDVFEEFKSRLINFIEARYIDIQ